MMRFKEKGNLPSVIMWLILALTAFSCTTITVATPEGFASMNEGNERSFLALSPEGIRMEVYTQANEPVQELSFWVEAYTFHMEESGYLPLQEAERIQGVLGEIHFAEWLVPYRGETYVYAHGILVSGETLYVAEIGGPQAIYGNYREGILEALKTIE